MTVYRKTAGNWSKIKTIYRKSGGSWNTVKQVWRKTGGIWRRVYLSALLPEIESQVLLTISSTATQTKKLTGRVYHWNDADSITYRFLKSTDGISFSAISGASGTSTNPLAGSSNTSDQYTLSQSDMVANTTNYFKYESKASNSTYSTEQTSTSVYEIIEMPRDLTLSLEPFSASITVTFNNDSTGSGRYGYQYKLTTDSTWSTEAFSSPGTITTSISITSLTSNKDYDVRVRGWTGTSNGYGYYGNWAYGATKTLAPSEPVIVSYPVLSGSQTVGNSLTPTPGSYTNYVSKETAILATTYSSVTQGELVASYTLKTSFSNITYFPHTITQSDATNVKYTFYAVDKVVGVGNITYYYYSNPIVSAIGTITDTFGRTVASGTGIGTSSSGYIYNGPNVGSAWSVDGSNAINNNTVSASTSPASWPKQLIEMGGQTDVSVKVQFPTSDAGLGVAFWVSTAGSWWAATSYKASLVTSGITCTGTTQTGTTCPTVGTNVGDYCDCVTVTVPEIAPACTVSKTGMPDAGGSLGTTAGARCTDATPLTQYLCNTSVVGSTSNPTVVFGPYSSSQVGSRCTTGTSNTTYACTGSVSGASSAGSLATLPYIASDVGSRCSTAVANTVYSCSDAVTGQASAGSLASTPYIASDVGVRCTAATANTVYSCNNAVTGRSSVGSLASAPYGAGDVGARCSTYVTNTNTTYYCGTAVTGRTTAGSLATTYALLTLGQRCTAATTVVTYSCSGSVTGSTTCPATGTVPYSAADVGKRCGTCTSSGSGSSLRYSYSTITSATTYDYSVVASSTTTTYDYTTVSSSTTYSYSRVASSTTYSYSTVQSSTTRDYNTVGSSTTYSYYVNDNGTPASTGKSWKTQVSGNVTLYKTYLRVYSANGSTATLESENEVASSPSAYATVWGAGVTTQGNTLTASLYSNSALTSTVGSPTYLTLASPTKSDPYGSTYAGIIKGYTVDGQGTRFDNLTIIPSL